VKSIGRGGLFDGSRIAVDDFSADSFLVSTIDTERTIMVSASLKEAGAIMDQVECEHKQRSGPTCDANNAITASREKTNLKKNRKAKKCVSFNDVPFVIGYCVEQDDDDGAETELNDVTPFVTLDSPPLITVPNTFEIVEEDADVPELASSNIPTERYQDRSSSRGALPVISEVISPWPIENELSDSSAVLAPGQFSVKQMEDSSCSRRDKEVSTVPFHPGFVTDDHFIASRAP
jgi:hypothetical protein